jgi:adenylylsulfate kinase-like enzyme
MSANKITLAKPVLICFYGFPGAGKSYVARNLSDSIQLANVSGDRIRSELFENPRYDAQENAIVTHAHRDATGAQTTTVLPSRRILTVMAALCLGCKTRRPAKNTW